MRLPLTILSGYLGAGKTTLIKKLLSADHGLRIRVLVNDFGEINLDAASIKAQSENVIALTNGCVCCSMEGDLFAALNEALDSDPRPDHIIVEASGIADPAAIASAALIEKEIGYAGIITLVDALNVSDLLADEKTAAPIAQQIRAADLALITKTQEHDPKITQHLSALGARSLRLLSETPLERLLFDISPLPRSLEKNEHPAYVSWSRTGTERLSRSELGIWLTTRPTGLYRLKGTVLTDDGAYELHIVGQHVHAQRTQAQTTTLVALGLAYNLSVNEIQDWWERAPPERASE